MRNDLNGGENFCFLRFELLKFFLRFFNFFLFFILLKMLNLHEVMHAFLLQYRKLTTSGPLRPSRLVQRIDMIPNKPRSTHNVFRKYFLPNFFETQSQEGHSPKLSFWRSPMQFCIKIEKSPLVDLCKH